MDLQIQRVDLSYKASFAEPQFSLLNATRTLHFLFGALKGFGLRSSDLKVEGNIANLPEFAVTCAFTGFNSMLRVRLESLELNAFAFVAGNSPPLSKIVTAALVALKDIAAPNFTGTATHEVLWAVHGVPGVPVMDYLRKFIDSKPPAPPSGVAFTIGPDPTQGRLNASATVAVSAVVTDGLYVQINGVYDGRQSPDEVRDRFEAMITASLKMLDITPPITRSNG